MSASLPVPADHEAERAALGAVLYAPAVVGAVADQLMPEHFDLYRHGEVWAAVLAVHARGDVPDVTTVARELRRRETFDEAGGLAGLFALVQQVADPDNIRAYAASVRDAALKRGCIEAGGKMRAAGFDPALDGAAALAAGESALAALQAQAVTGGGFATLAGIVQHRADSYSAVLEGDAQAPGVPTGLPDLDDRLGSLKPGQLITIAGRPAMGKTALMLSIVRRQALAGFRPAVVSLEMGRDELIDRWAAMETGIPLDHISNYRVSADCQGDLFAAFGRIAGWPVRVDDTRDQAIGQIRAAARRAHQAQPLDALFVDYLQLITPPPGLEGDEVRALTAISRGLKVLAGELGIPVIALSQLSRAVEGRQNKRPLPSDMRGSGSIEQDSDVILFPYRDEVYDPETEAKGIAEIIIAKQRNGPLGMAPARWDSRRAEYQPLERYRAPEGY